MKENRQRMGLHPLGDPLYRANGAPAVAHGCVTYMDVGEGREPGAASFVTPRNRITISRRYALPCTTSEAPFTLSN